ncbi:MAG: hypothetical protein WCX73_04695 [Candidatus Pacearchaeota archaeon]
MKKSKISNIKKKKGKLWYFLRISFWVMIATWALIALLPDTTGYLDIINVIWIITLIFTFVTSIIHLVKYKEKAFAITALVIASIGIFLLIIGIGMGISEGLKAIEA